MFTHADLSLHPQSLACPDLTSESVANHVSCESAEKCLPSAIPAPPKSFCVLFSYRIR